MNTGIFFDIDGTLRDVGTGAVPRSTQRALHRLRECGYYLGVSTGRAIHEIEQDIMQLVDWDAFICNNGQVVYTRDAGKIYEQLIPEDAVAACLEVSAKAGSPLDLVDEHSRAFLTAPANRYVKEAFQFFNLPINQVKPYRGEKILAAMVFGPPHHSYAEYRAIPGLSVLPGISTYADICPSNVSKHTGIAAVMERNNLEDYIAFGDALNDLEMLENAKLSVALGNSHPQVADMATYHTSAVLDDGIERACKALQLY